MLGDLFCLPQCGHWLQEDKVKAVSLCVVVLWV